MRRVLVLDPDVLEVVDDAEQEVGHHGTEYDPQEEVEGELGEVDVLKAGKKSMSCMIHVL